MENKIFIGERKFGTLRERIKMLYTTQNEFAEALGVNVATLNFKLNGKTEFTRAEMEKACYLLDGDLKNLRRYFFY